MVCELRLKFLKTRCESLIDVLLDGLNEFASVHFEEVLSRWNLICGTHFRWQRPNSLIVELFCLHNTLNFIISVPKRVFKVKDFG